MVGIDKFGGADNKLLFLHVVVHSVRKEDFGEVLQIFD